MVFNFGERPGLPRQCLEFPQEDHTALSNHYHESYKTRKISKIFFSSNFEKANVLLDTN